MRPIIGQNVHYIEKGEIYAGIVVGIHSDTCVNLQVIDEHGMRLETIISLRTSPECDPCWILPCAEQATAPLE